jgi:hypothetical protein
MTGQLAAGIDTSLERNRDFAAAGDHEAAVVFPNLRPFPINCLDPRVDPAHFRDLGLADAAVVRNVGGRVTSDVIDDAFTGQIAESLLPDGSLFEVAVVHHTQAEPARSPPTPSAGATPSGSAPSSRPSPNTPSSTPSPPSPATSPAFAPHPRSPRASPSQDTSTTSPPDGWRPSSPPPAEEPSTNSRQRPRHTGRWQEGSSPTRAGVLARRARNRKQRLEAWAAPPSPDPCPRTATRDA